MRYINRLSDSVVSRLRSGAVLSDSAQIAEELVCNSIDAGATQIQVDVDAEAWFLKVEDDGCGISRDDLTVVGERHATSKLYDLEELEKGVTTLGFRGEALSSLSDIALVEITSRCRGTPNTYRKILKDSATVSVGLCSQQRSHGTTVVIKDMFYNQPVRRRLMSTSHRKILQSVKERVVRFVLMHPSISFKVTDLARSEVSVHTKSATSLSTTLCGIFGKDLLLSLEEVDRCEGRLKIAGYLSRKYHSLNSKTLQFFYINRRFVRKTPIHKLLNKWAQLSKNGTRSMVVTSTQRLDCGGRGAGKQDGNSDRHLLPAFVLNLSCPPSEYDITFEASKTIIEFKDWLPVLDFVRSVLKSIWGNLSDVPEGGPIHPFGRSPELSVNIDSRNKIIRQQTSSVPYTGTKNIPPMSVRRALVQGGLVDLRSPINGCVERKVGEFTSHGSRQSRSRHRDSSSSAHDSYGNRGERRYPSETFSVGPETIEKILTDSSDNGSEQPIPKRQWNMASCGQRGTLPKSVLSSETMNFFGPCIPASSSPSASDSFTNLRLELSPDSTSVTSRCNVKWIGSSSDSAQIARSHSLVKTFTKCTSVEGVMESKDWNYNNRISKVQRIESCAFIEDMEVEYGRAPSEVPDLNMGEMLWSGSENSYNSMSSPDSSYLLPECRSRPPNELDAQESLAWTFSGNDESRCNVKDKFRRQAKRSSLSEMLGPDNNNIEDPGFYGKECRPKDCSKDVTLPGPSEGESWKVYTEASEAHGVNDQKLEQLLMEGSVRKLINNYGNRDRPLYSSHQNEFGKSSVLSRPRVKRKLEMFFSGYVNNSGKSPHYRDGLEVNKYDFDRDSSIVRSKRQRRSHSGPPVYKPPNRCGLHENPPNSLSTTEKGTVDIFEDANHCTNRAGVTAVSRENGTDQAVEDTKCPINKSSDSTFTSLCSRKGLDVNADECVERSHTKEDSSRLLTRYLDISEVTPVQQEPSDVTRRGQNGAVSSCDAIGEMLKEWSNPCMKNDEGVLDLSSGILCWNSISFLPDSIVKESLLHARVLQQVDKKFIPAVAGGVLLMIDQHAADERVRLEELRDHVLGSGQIKQAAPLSCTQELTLAFPEQEMLQTYREQIEDWGWRFRFGESSKTIRAGSSVLGMCNLLLSAVPCILGVMLTGEDLTEYLRQLMDTQGSSAPPPAVIRILNYKACRGAIMFGDTLLPAESRQLVEHLKQTSLCFQCAHGRPTMVPLVDLRGLHKRLLPSDSTCGNVGNLELPSRSTALNLGLPIKEWHRLQSRRSSLERSLERLEQAKQ